MRPKQVIQALELLVNRKRPAFLWGPPGVGKSDIIAQVAKRLDMQLVDRRAATMGPTDAQGFPCPDTIEGVMKWLPPDFLPPMMIKKEVTTTTGKGKTAKTTTSIEMVPNDSKGILFLDELNQAVPAIQATLYQLLLDRRIGNYTLPDGWSILAAGNRESDRANAQRMPSALALRLVHLDYDINVDDWCEWALEQGDMVPTELLAFIRFKPGLLHKFDPSQRVSPNPRSWVFVGQLTHSKLDAIVETELFNGAVGEGPATEYRAFLQIYRDLPTVNSIKLNPDTVPIPSSPAVNYALTAALAAATEKDTFPRFMQYIKRMGVEWQVTYMRDAKSRTKNSITNDREFINWSLKNAAVIT